MRDLGAEPRLVVPEGLLIDESVRERLVRELATAPADVAGIAAEIATLVPGASYRVHTEWTALENRAPLARHRGGAVRGAVLVRADADCMIRDGAVEVESGAVFVDPGAQVHDPHRPPGPLEVASERGRPPFPRRPVVVFLGCEQFRDPDWLRRLVNRLVRHDVEARIAFPLPNAGTTTEASSPSDVHLTRPCLAGEATIRTLAPDVVVTLDATAAAQIDAWCEGDRSTVVVDLDLTLAHPMELVSWQIGRASAVGSKRRRARIGRWVEAPAFAALVGRLCAGPHPIAPSDKPELLELRTAVREHWTRPESVPGAEGCVVLTGTLDGNASARVEGLVDNLAAQGIPALTRRVGATANDLPSEARAAALVLLAGVTAAPSLDALIADRKRAGLPTAVDLTAADLEAPGPETPAGLTGSATALAEACGLVVAPVGARLAVARGAALRAIDLPTLLTRARVAALREARATIDPTSALVIGWCMGTGDRSAAYADAVGEGIARILAEHRDRVEIVGDAARVPAALRGHERVRVVPRAEPDPAMIAGWAVHVWTPELLGDEILDDARRLEEAGCAGVPSIMPLVAHGGVDGFVSSHVLVESVDTPDHWYDALHHVLDDPIVRQIRAHEAARRTDALDELAISKAVVSRFMGRVTYQPERASV